MRISTTRRHLENNLTKQDAVVLNLQRACEASIDIAIHIVKEKRLGLPKSARESFDLLSENSIIQPQTARRMKNMIGFRNVAVHDYQSLSLDIVIDIVLHRLEDFKEFLAEVDNDSD